MNVVKLWFGFSAGLSLTGAYAAWLLSGASHRSGLSTDAGFWTLALLAFLLHAGGQAVLYFLSNMDDGEGEAKEAIEGQ